MFAITMRDKGIKLIRSFCNQKHIACIFGFPRKENEKIYNSACIIDKNGEIIGIYDKTHLWGKENLIFQKGNKLSVFNTSIGKIGILICYDIDFPEPSRILTLKNADIICCISANMKPYDNIHKTFIKTRSLENNIPIVYCNYVGNDDFFEYVGQSNIIDRMGKPQQKFSRQDKLLYGDIDLNYKCENSYIKDLRTDLYYSEYYNDKLNK